MSSENLKQRSPEWFARRISMITGSRIGSILGLNPYEKDTDVLRSMIREYFGYEREFKGSPATEYGTRNEANAIADYEFLTNNKVQDVGFVKHPEIDFLGCSPDGLVGDNAVLEVKAPYRGLKRKITTYYYAQMQLEMACTQRNSAHFFEWSPEDTYLEHVPIDPTWLDSILPTLREFIDEYNAIIADESRYSQYLEPEVVERNDSEWQQAVDEYIAADEAVRAANERKTDARSRLIELAGERPTQGAGVKLNKVETKGSIDWAALAKDQGLDGEQYRKPASQTWRITRSDK